MEKIIKKINLGYKYKLLPNKEQSALLNHHMFIYNQAFNICLNLWNKEYNKNASLPKELRTYRTPVDYDKVVKRSLKFRKLIFSSVILQQARINFLLAVKKTFSKEIVEKRLKAIEKAITPKEKEKASKLGFPVFKSSKDIEQSFNWNNQACSIIESKNPKYKILRILKQQIKFRFHRDFPLGYKLCGIVISKDVNGYYVSFNIEYSKEMDLGMSIDNIDISKCIGIDLNAYNFAVSKDVMFLEINDITRVYQNHLIDNGATNRKSLLNNKNIKRLKRKQSRRVLKALNTAEKTKTKFVLGKNFKKTQIKINKNSKIISNKKSDLYHKITTQLTNKFEMIVVEDLKLKNMTKSSKGNEEIHGKRVKQKSGLNKTILNSSFYQFVSMIKYKTTMLNDKLFVKVDPKYTSQECSCCGNRDKDNRPKQDKFKCTECGYETNPDIQASKTILNRGLMSFGVGITLVDIKHKAFCSETIVSAN